MHCTHSKNEINVKGLRLQHTQRNIEMRSMARQFDCLALQLSTVFWCTIAEYTIVFSLFPYLSLLLRRRHWFLSLPLSYPHNWLFAMRLQYIRIDLWDEDDSCVFFSLSCSLLLLSFHHKTDIWIINRTKIHRNEEWEETRAKKTESSLRIVSIFHFRLVVPPKNEDNDSFQGVTQFCVYWARDWMERIIIITKISPTPDFKNPNRMRCPLLDISVLRMCCNTLPYYIAMQLEWIG